MTACAVVSELPEVWIIGMATRTFDWQCRHDAGSRCNPSCCRRHVTCRTFGLRVRTVQCKS
jgi:hypothetical protein